MEFPHRKDPNNSLRDTLLDGEMIVDIVNGQKVPRYLIYDIVKYAVSFDGNKFCLRQNLHEINRDLPGQVVLFQIKSNLHHTRGITPKV